MDVDIRQLRKKMIQSGPDPEEPKENDSSGGGEPEKPQKPQRSRKPEKPRDPKKPQPPQNPANPQQKPSARRTISVGVCVYFAMVLIIYIIICLSAGKPGWIVLVLTSNLASDITGDEPRMLAAEYADSMIYDPAVTGDQEAYDDAADALANAIILMIPTAFLFSCTDSFITDRLHTERLADKAVCFLASYILQAAIAVICFDVTDWGAVMSSAATPIFSIWIFGGLAYMTVMMFKDDSVTGGFNVLVNRVVGVMMSLIYALFIETVKMLILVMLFSVAMHGVNFLLSSVGLGWIIAKAGILLAVVYIVMNRLLNKASDFLSEKFMRAVTAGTDAPYRKTFTGELFCFAACIITMVCILRM